MVEGRKKERKKERKERNERTDVSENAVSRVCS